MRGGTYLEKEPLDQLAVRVSTTKELSSLAEVHTQNALPLLEGELDRAPHVIVEVSVDAVTQKL